MTRHITAIRRDLLEVLARVSAIDPDLLAAWSNLRDAQPGFPTSTGGSGAAPSRNDDGHPGGLEKYLGRPDPAAEDLRLLDLEALKLNRCAASLHDLVTRWAATTGTEDGKAERTRLPGGDCVACARYCSGKGDDRLRAGLCDACRSAWGRWTATHSGERGDWLLERRAVLTQSTEDAA